MLVVWMEAVDCEIRALAIIKERIEWCDCRITEEDAEEGFGWLVVFRVDDDCNECSSECG